MRANHRENVKKLDRNNIHRTATCQKAVRIAGCLDLLVHWLEAVFQHQPLKFSPTLPAIVTFARIRSNGYFNTSVVEGFSNLNLDKPAITRIYINYCYKPGCRKVLAIFF